MARGVLQRYFIWTTPTTTNTMRRSLWLVTLKEWGGPTADQIGSRTCPACKRWFRSAEGLAVHKCLPDNDRSLCPVAGPSSSAPNSVAAVPVSVRTQLSLLCYRAHCSACGRGCRSKRGFQLHACAKYNRTLVGR